ncbi:MBL fold metallo-hydrolase [Mycetohabitans sp. B8]|uniref:MBL fold metallo-hydrolase n=1 Tax=Mycetohabitans sp. B8 TaxID=2841845 RepID=UPI001F196FC1|nr:MBL fold metallo-hydrolase [Mycetohabitans sp. B8]
MRFASLGSGSDGNSLLVEAQDGTTTTRVLLDCGFSARELERRLARLDVTLDALHAIVITHEHADHIGSALTVARRASIPLYMSWGTALAVGADDAKGVEWRVLWGGEPVGIGDLELLPYTVPHDAREPLQFVFGDGQHRVGVLTDVGTSTPHIIQMLNGCDGLVLECNHDVRMLAQSRYPPSLKARIGGMHGHLNNDEAATILAAIDRSKLRCIIAAHLSQQNNLPELARNALATVLSASSADVIVATQEDGFGWQTL